MPDEKFPSKEERAALFKEWEQDAALRQREDAHSRPTHPWPSEIAKVAKQAKQPDKPRTNDKDSGHSL